MQQPKMMLILAVVGLTGLLVSMLGDALDYAELPDDLRAAKGIVRGSMISLATWCVLADVVFLLA